MAMETRFECAMCGKDYSRADTIPTRHWAKHHRGIKYNVKTHVRKVEKPSKVKAEKAKFRFQCTICGRDYSRADSIPTRHWARHHKGIKYEVKIHVCKIQHAEENHDVEMNDAEVDETDAEENDDVNYSSNVSASESDTDDAETDSEMDSETDVEMDFDIDINAELDSNMDSDIEVEMDPNMDPDMDPAMGLRWTQKTWLKWMTS